MTRHLLMIVLLSPLFLGGCAGGATAPGPQTASLDPAAGTGAPYQLGPGDQIDVTVFGEDNLSGTFDLDETGAFSMPLAGPINVRDKTARQAEAAIAARLADGLVTDPKVSVNVKRYRPIYVLGEVQKPGAYPAYGATSVLNAVALAGGYTYRASTGGITVMRYGDPSHRAVPAGETDSVLPGDTVSVPERWF